MNGGDRPYPTLWTFFGGYMHEDWHDDHADEWAALDEFIQDTPEAVTRFRSEIRELLNEHQSEVELRSIVLDDLGSYAAVDLTGWKYRDWLQALSDHAAKAQGHPEAS